MKRFFFFILSAILILSCSKSPEQLKQDSDKYFNQALDYYERGYLSQAADLFEKVISIENKLGNAQRKANSYIYLGLINYQISDFKKSENYYKEALKILREVNDKKNELLVLNNIAGIHSALGEYDEAIKIYSDIIGKSLIFADKESEAIAALNLGELYQEQWDFDKSFEYFNKSFDAYEILGDVKGKIYTLNKIGELFIASKNFPSALKSFDMAIEINNKSGLKYLNQEIYNNIGLVYFYENQILKAKEIFELALNSVQSEESNQLILISLKNNLGDCEFQNQVYSNAIKYYKEALDLSERSFLKFLSPILQLKIAKSFERLYFINNQESDKKSAERFYQFAVNRFKENYDWKNLQKALTSFSSFYSKIGDKKKSISYFDELKRLDTFFELKPDDHLKYFAIKPDYDFAFLPILINQNEVENVFKFIEKLKFNNALEYFLRFRNFNFLEIEQAKKLESLKREILYLNTYQRILTNEISLPPSQRIKEKLKIASKITEDTEEKIKQLLNSLSNDYKFIKYINSDEEIFKFIDDRNKVYVELFPTEKDLVGFFISKEKLKAKIFSSDVENFKFNLQILSNNLNVFSLDELKNFSSNNFSQIADELIDEINLNYRSAREIIFISNQTKSDFFPHLFYSKKNNQFIFERFEISYSYFIGNENLLSKVNSLNILKEGRLQSSNEISSNQLQEIQVLSHRDKELTKRKIRLGLRQPHETEIKTSVKSEVKESDGIIILDDVLFNSSSPELSYLKTKSQTQQSKFYLRELMSAKAKFLLFRSLKLDDLQDLGLFLSIFSFTKTNLIILPFPNTVPEITENFLYNYIKRVENKNLNQASKEFFDLIKNQKELKIKAELYWIKFIN